MREAGMHDIIARLYAAVNRHDADGMAACFAPDYRSEQPAHPNRGFGGHRQVAANWSTLFAGVPDLTAEVVAATIDGRTTWTECEFRGHYADGSLFASRGVNLMGLNDDGLIAWGRLYIEEVEQGGADIEETVQQLSGTTG
jgi:ketosteroid isomerase-like protein